VVHSDHHFISNTVIIRSPKVNIENVAKEVKIDTAKLDDKNFLER
jgi:hypothetical protein